MQYFFVKTFFSTSRSLRWVSSSVKKYHSFSTTPELPRINSLMFLQNLILFSAFNIVIYLFFKFLWEYLFIYLYAKHIRNCDDERLKKSLKYTPDSWALITGATDGIGKTYALLLARLGFKLFLLGRSSSKLEETKNYIMNDEKVKNNNIQNGVWIDTGVLDFSINGYEKTREVITKLMETNQIRNNLKLLVNCAGISYDKATFFMDVPDGYKTFKNIIDVNINSVLNVTKTCLPYMGMKPRSEAGASIKKFKDDTEGGIVINISSFSAVVATPCLAVYAATKAFVWHLTACLEGEYRDSGIYFQTVTPYLVATKMTRLKRTSLFRPDPLTYVKDALLMVGVQNTTFGCWPHAIVGLGAKLGYFLAPQSFAKLVISGVKSYAKDQVNVNDKELKNSYDNNTIGDKIKAS